MVFPAGGPNQEKKMRKHRGNIPLLPTWYQNLTLDFKVGAMFPSLCAIARVLFSWNQGVYNIICVMTSCLLSSQAGFVHTTRNQKLWTRNMEGFRFLGVGGNWSTCWCMCIIWKRGLYDSRDMSIITNGRILFILNMEQRNWWTTIWKILFVDLQNNKYSDV